ncbi:hypothetical protein E2C01_097838 [Portunus trituberculatus]|uniref:Uncharacterized protein n=1 Tax=Portunus trituberculatus TaxID=210409 RepID=A0A5B7KCF0_PORTR|nr:hypothetical protein [Portunus trituberculatus]
MPRYPTLRSP